MNSSFHTLVQTLVCLSFSGVAGLTQSATLYDFEGAFDGARILHQDAKSEVIARGRGHALRIETGHSRPWPGVTLKAPDGDWDVSAFATITLRVRNVGSNSATLNCRLDNAGADGLKHCVTGSAKLAPGTTGILRVPLTRYGSGKLDGKLFGMRGYPVEPGGDYTFDPRHLTQILLFVNHPAEDLAFEVYDIRAEGRYVPPTASVGDADPYFPLIDTFGQYRQRDWPGKIHSQVELNQRRRNEREELASQPGPEDWDQYGGWKSGPQLKATGFFRTEKRAGKWWLVDPEGRLFWSHGIDCVRMLDSTVIEERESWFADYPGALPEFVEFVLPHAFALKGHYAGRFVSSFSFAGANLRRKYGEEWKSRFREIIHQRLRSWGLNTIGNWSDESVRLQHRTPYVDSISSSSGRQIEGSEGYWGKFVDPFDRRFREGLRRSMEGRKGRTTGDPWCLGFFSDNEISWGDETSLALATLRSPADQPAKVAFVADLTSKYVDIARLNHAWGTAYVSWQGLLDSRTAPDKTLAGNDLQNFYSRIADTYFRTAREVVQEMAPGQLYLGCRFASSNPRAAAAAAKYCDVVSYNIYERTLADFQFSGGADVPLLVGEFHFGALDRGMFHTGLVPTASQEERAQAYTSYVQSALRHPQFVGCHWFQYQDEPTTGRVYDEENYQIGFVDIADTPYAETIAASRTAGERLYTERIRP